jgi:hypothetical protein
VLYGIKLRRSLMFRYVLALTFAVNFATAATISTSATCDGVTTFGTTNAFCNDGRFMADASLGAPSIVSNPGPGTFGVSVSAGPITLGFGSASARFSGDYVFTVNGGIGNGFFCPVIFVFHSSGGSAGMSFAGIEGFSCDVFSEYQPFTFGVPQIVGIGMGGDAGSGSRTTDASAFLDQIAFSDPAGNPLSNVTYTLASVDLPEPSTLSLLSVGLMFFVAARIRRMRFRGSHPNGLHSPGLRKSRRTAYTVGIC